MTDLLAGYRAAGPGHDEMLQATGAAREAWGRLADLAGLADARQLEWRADAVENLLRSHGVRQGSGPDERPWRLDPIPMIIDEVEWRRLERGLAQRASLLDLVLADLYGDATLLSTGVLPPELVLGHPGFQRAIHGVLRRPRQLFLHGADLARNADGAWQVLGDHAEIPLGMGYAMQNRRIVAEVLADLYRHARIHRLGPFFQQVRHAVAQAAPRGANRATAPGDGAPRAVLLTPGSDSPAAFDHAYLATMLGYPLVHGGDLEVRDGRVWMRTLEGHEPVDVVLRHVPAVECDPLDIPPAPGVSHHRGVPGLAEAVRVGGVTVLNPLGAGVLDNHGILTYLPRVARAVLGEELLIASTVTYWCGERAMCSHVIAHLDRLVVRSTLARSRAVHGWKLSIAERADLAARIASQPHLWVGQEPVEASTTPTVHDGALVARSTRMRTFAVAGEEGYEVMVGGLARVTLDSTDVMAPGTRAVAKDVWVLASQPDAPAAPWAGWDAETRVADSPAGLDRHPSVLDGVGSGRSPRGLAGGAGAPVAAPAPAAIAPAAIAPAAAERFFHLGRQAERAEGAVRLLRATVVHLAEPTGSVGGEAYVVLRRAVEQVLGPGSLGELLADVSNDASVGHAVVRLARHARAVRDQLPPQTWATLSWLERAIDDGRVLASGGDFDEALFSGVTARLLEGLLALAGIAAESLVRDAGWWLLEAGRRIERARRLLELLEALLVRRLAPGVESVVLEALLQVNVSFIAYSRQHQAWASVESVLGLLLFDECNPRSLTFQMRRLQDVLDHVPGSSARAREDLVGGVVELLGEIDLRVAAEPDAGGLRRELGEAVRAMMWRLDELETEVVRVHFARVVSVPWGDGVLVGAAGGAAGAARQGDQR